MKAKFERCGQPIPMRVDKRDYLFQKDHNGDFVALVEAENHVNHLLGTGNFEIVGNDNIPDNEQYEDVGESDIFNQDTNTTTSAKRSGRKVADKNADASIMDI